jgi:hypothetical protein
MAAMATRTVTARNDASLDTIDCLASLPFELMAFCTSENAGGTHDSATQPRLNLDPIDIPCWKRPSMRVGDISCVLRVSLRNAVVGDL